MNDTSDTLSSSSAATTISDRDIDRLLREAEALTGAIEADDQNLSSESDDGTQISETAEDRPCETDSQGANDTETATGQPDGFKDLLHDPDAGLETQTDTQAVTSAETQSEQTIEHGEQAADTDSEDAASLSEDQLSDEVIQPDAAFADDTGKIGPSQPDVTRGDSESAASGDQPTTDNLQDADSESEQLASEEVLDESHSAVHAFKIKLSKFIGFATRSAKAAPAAGVNAALSVFVYCDRPFARVSIGTKRVFGYVAIATLLSGIAARFLPDLLYNNPFAEMGTGIQQVG